MGWRKQQDAGMLELKTPKNVGELMKEVAASKKLTGPEIMEFINYVGFLYSVNGQSQQTSGFLGVKMGDPIAVEYQIAHTKLLIHATEGAHALADKAGFGDQARKAIDPPDFTSILDGLEDLKNDIANGRAPRVTDVIYGVGTTEEEASKSLASNMPEGDGGDEAKKAADDALKSVLQQASGTRH